MKKEMRIYGKRPTYIHTGPAGGGQAKHADPDLSTYEQKKHVHIQKELYIYIKRHVCIYPGPA